MSGVSTRGVLAAIAGVAGLMAAFAGSPFATTRATVDVDRLAAAVAHEEDHVTALELAEWIRDRRSGLRIIDLRSADAFDEYHLPRAEQVPIEKLTRTPFRQDETIVLVSDAGGHAAQGWVLLQALGHRHVFFLRGGLADWIDDVMNPTLAVGASPDEITAFRRVSAISRYFGGVPRVTGNHTTRFDTSHVPGNAEPTTMQSRELRRRGC